MKIRAFIFSLLVVLFSGSTLAQLARYNFQFAKAFPNANYKIPLGAHGIAVDPEGKVWVQPFAGPESLNVGGTWKKLASIHIFNPDGSNASFSPIRFVTVGGVTDTLFAGNNRGMNADKNGNIVFTQNQLAGSGRIYRVNYKTGAGINKTILGPASSPTAPAFDDLNEMFIGYVAPGLGPLRIYDANFSQLGYVTDSTQGFARTLGVSADGSDVLWCGFTNGYVTKYHSANGSLGPYSQVQNIMNGLVAEAIGRHPQTGYWWVGGGNPTSGSNMPPYRDYTYYAFAPPNYATPVDSFTWQGVNPLDEPRPRGIAFSPTGDTVYVCAFNVSNDACVQMFVRGVPPVSPYITVAPASFNVSAQSGDSTTRTLTIGNLGDADLTWNIAGQTIASFAAGLANALQPSRQIAVTASSNDNTAVTVCPATSRYVPTSKVLVIKDQQPWGKTSLDTVLARLGVVPTIINSYGIASANFSQYDLIIVASQQPMAFYQTVVSQMNKFTTYVQNGGRLEFHYVPFSSDFVSMTFPGGATSFLTIGAINIITDATHPIASGIPRILTGSSASHVGFGSLPSGARVISRDSATNTPTTIEYNHGAGRILLTGMTWEFYFGSGAIGQMLTNAVAYMLSGTSSQFITVVPSSGTVIAGGSQNVTVKINAKTLAVGNYNGNIGINNNDPVNNPKNIPVNLTVTPGPSPVITVTPPTLSFTLPKNDSATAKLTIGNIGVVDLAWSIGSPSAVAEATNAQVRRRTEGEIAGITTSVQGRTNGGGQGAPTVSPYRWQDLLSSIGSKRILAWVGYADRSPSGEFENSISAIKKYYTDFTLDTTTTVSPSVLTTLLADKDVFIVPEQEMISDLTSLGVSFAASLNSFVQSGKTMIVMDYYSTGSTTLLNGTGLLNITGIFPVVSLTAVVHDVGNPLVAGLPSQFTALNGVNYHSSSNGQKIIRDLSTSSNVVTLRNVGAGRVIYIGMDFFSYNNDMARLLANAVQTTSSTSAFISANPESGIVAPGSSQEITVKVNSTGMKMGAYTGNLSITSNDPVNNPKNVPVGVTVTPGPSPTITVSPSSLSVTLWQGDSTTRTMTIGNAGVVSLDWNIGGGVISTAPGKRILPLREFNLPTPSTVRQYDPDAQRLVGRKSVMSENAMTTLNGSTFISQLASMAGVRILFDYGHAQYGDTSQFAVLLSDLRLRGASVDMNTAAFTSGLLALYDIVIITEGSGTYSSAELSALQSWVSGGGGLFVEGDSFSGNFADIVVPYGMLYLGTSSWNGYTTNIVPHPTTSGCDSVFLSGPVSTLSVSSPAMTVVFDLSGGTHMAVSQHGGGRVVVVSDDDFPGVFILQGDNRTLGNRAADWLAGGASFWSVAPSSGTIPPGSTQNVTVSISAKGMVVSSFADNIVINNNDPYNNPKNVPITLTVDGPNLTSISPNSAIQGQSLSVSITGQNTSFRVSQASSTIDVSNVWLNQGLSTINATNVTVFSATLLQANFTIPNAANVGSWNINVEQPVGKGVVTRYGGFTVIAKPVPTIVSVSPSTATQGQTLPVSITGQNTSFRVVQASSTVDANHVWLNLGLSVINATSVTVSSATYLTANFTIPASAPIGYWNVNVEQPLGLGTVSASGWFYINIGSSIPTPRIIYVRDVPNDNGKQVYVRWRVDVPAVSGGISRFGVWRKDSIWTFLKDSVLAVNDTVFQFVAPTIYDSTKVSGMKFSLFRVTAHAFNPAIYTMSTPDSGYSVDNLPPSVPKGVRGSVQSGGMIAFIQWNKVPEKDLRYYAVYRSETSGFTNVDSMTFVGASADTTYRDSTVTYGKRYYYRIVAFDWSGNRSEPSDQFAMTILSVGRYGTAIPDEFSLAQNYPNPFNPATTIRYGVPAQSRVRLQIFNTIGQVVATLVDGERDAGYYETEWKASVASGIYIYRIEAVASDNQTNAFVQVKKMLLVK